MLKSALKNAALCLTAAVVSALVLEFGLRLAARQGWIEIDINPLSGFWADSNPDWGVWHRPNATFTHEKSCFRVNYASNSYGALDKERSRDATAPRVVVLGDSMMEGMTLETPTRLSNLLEQATGIEHLNFATSQTFGPVQYLLVYEKLAKQFAHDVVLVGFLPENDFTDSNWEIGQKAFYNRYRPYFVGGNGHYELVHFNKAYFDGERREKGEGLERPFLYLWDNSMTLRAMRRAWAIRQFRTVVDDQVVQAAEPLTKGIRSFYYDYDAKDQDITRYTLAKLVQAAEGRPVVILTIPMQRDLLNLKDRGTPPLPAWFATMSRELGFTYLDLMPVLAAHPEQWDDYYHRCDHHWTAKANALVLPVVAPVIEQAIAKAHAARQ
ncbi:MAG: hypothetical protein JOY64_07380 [Alphaproteobacteria bacterium]|nr:hypothetical protein [Alphaproteobacteria bacterium]MBV8407435.1 hypothetical protein [Alphaproteobacteria bacterium]